MISDFIPRTIEKSEFYGNSVPSSLRLMEMDHTASILPYTIMTSPLHHKTQRLSSQGTQGPSSPAEISFKLKGLETGPLNFSYSDVTLLL